jgi:hypothetical protein
VIRFQKHRRKDDLAHEFWRRFNGREGGLFICKAQEKNSCSACKGVAKRKRGPHIPRWNNPPRWLITTGYTAWSREFGPFFLIEAAVLTLYSEAGALISEPPTSEVVLVPDLYETVVGRFDVPSVSLRELSA